MNRQEAFDIAAKHLLDQGKKAYRDDGTPFSAPSCAYRSPEGGLKCAIGALIPDEEYDPRFEGQNAAVLLRQSYCPAVLKSGDLTKDFLQALQCVHDDAHGDGDVEEFRRGLMEFASRWKLRVDVVTSHPSVVERFNEAAAVKE